METKINNTKIVVPSLPAHSFEEIQTLVSEIGEVATQIQVDIVDGQFAPFFSWPFTEVDGVKLFSKLKEISEKLDIEMDCMVMHPEQYLDTFVELGVKRVIIHMGSTQKYKEIIAHAQSNKYVLGFAIMNDTPLASLAPFIEEISFVQVMGIASIGRQGQPFDERTLDTVTTLRTAYPALEIAVDGSVNADTIERLHEVGVNRFAPGSAVAKADDPAEAYKTLRSMVIK